MNEQWNYFNYFTEIEEHFRQVRSSGLFLLSPLDWALIESWKNSGVPLEAVLRGIDTAFEKWRARPSKRQNVNSIAYCTQAVFHEAQVMANADPGPRPKEVEAPFTLEELERHLARNAAELNGRPEYREISEALDRLRAEAPEHYSRLEDLERRLTVLEEKMSAIAKTTVSEDRLLEIRRDLDGSLRPYRGKMSAEQIAMLERQYLERRVLENARLPRLSLFYLR